MNVKTTLILMLLLLSIPLFNAPALVSEKSQHNPLESESLVPIPLEQEYSFVLEPSNRSTYLFVEIPEGGLYNFSLYAENNLNMYQRYSINFEYKHIEYNYFSMRNDSSYSYYITYSYGVDANSNRTINFVRLIISPNEIKIHLTVDLSLKFKLLVTAIQKISDAEELNQGTNTLEFKNVKDSIYIYKLYVLDFAESFYLFDAEQKVYGGYVWTDSYIYYVEKRVGSYSVASFSLISNDSYSSYAYLSTKAILCLFIYPYADVNITYKLNITKPSVQKVSSSVSFTISKDNPTEKKFFLLELNPDKVYHIGMEYLSGGNLSVRLYGYIPSGSSLYLRKIAEVRYYNEDNYKYSLDFWGAFIREEDTLFAKDEYGVFENTTYLYGYYITNDNGTLSEYSPGSLYSIMSAPLSGNKTMFPVVVTPHVYGAIDEDSTIKLIVEAVDTINQPDNVTFSVDKYGLAYKVFKVKPEMGSKYLIKAEVYSYNPSVGSVGFIAYTTGLVIDDTVFNKMNDANEYYCSSYQEQTAVYELASTFPTDEYIVLVYGSGNTTKVKVTFEKYQVEELESEKTFTLTWNNKLAIFQFNVKADVPYELYITNYNNSRIFVGIFDEYGKSPFKGFMNYRLQEDLTYASDNMSMLGKANQKGYILILGLSELPATVKVSLKVNDNYYLQGRNFGLMIGLGVGFAAVAILLLLTMRKKRG